MRLILEGLILSRGAFRLPAEGIFLPGTHLIWGRIGSGKSTLALTLAGALPGTGGRVIREEIRTTGLLMQFSEHQVTGRTVGAEVRTWSADPDRILPTLGLEDRAGEDPFRLSRGELRRLHLCCLLSRNPDLLLLDEPFGALDCRQRKGARRDLEDRQGITLMFTHNAGDPPRYDYAWEITGRGLCFRGRPGETAGWESRPPFLGPGEEV